MKRAINTLIELLDYIKSGSFPILVAFSGGKDSVALALYLLEQGIVPGRIHLHHHDVDGGGPNIFDWPCTLSYCQAFAKALDLPLYISFRAGGIAREIYRRNEPRQDVFFQKMPGADFFRIPANKDALNSREKFPAISSNLSLRWCSSTVKIDVLASVVCHHPDYQSELVVLTGERKEESKARSRYKYVEPYRSATQTREAIHGRLILDYPELAVWNIMARYHIQPHPAYMLGWNRCSCQTCIFGDPNIWATLALIDPGKIAAIHKMEKDIQFTMYPGGSIWNRVKSGQALSELDPFWVAQSLGRFTAPILVDQWGLPLGAFRKETAGAG